jgi:two-component system, NtrC family, response regulator AtoC
MQGAYRADRWKHPRARQPNVSSLVAGYRNWKLRGCTMSIAVLIVEDEILLSKNIQRFLEMAGHDVRLAGSVKDAANAMDVFHPDVVLLDYHLPDGSGLEWLEKLSASHPGSRVIFMTGHSSIELAVEAMKCGAADFITKPLVLGELGLQIQKLAGEEKKEKALSYYREKQAKRGRLEAITGQSTAIKQLKSQISALLDAEQNLTEGLPPPVLVSGETGTGKQLVARALHFDSKRHKAPFIELNCAALPEQIVESELFGHERGAFTDAKERKTGLFEAADGGTLFLDEVGELSLATQAKLLKALEDGKIRRLGSVREQAISVRVVAATNRNLALMISQGAFRSDLYFRLHMLEFVVPPLRDRNGDVLLLARLFLERLGEKYKRGNLRLSEEAQRALAQYNWPGNVRELRNLMERAVLLSKGNVMDCSVLSFPQAAPEEDPTASQIGQGKGLFDVERELLISALSKSNWNVSEASRILGISRDTLRYRIEKFDLHKNAASLNAPLQ